MALVWETAAALTIARQRHAVAADNLGRIYAIGGQSSGGAEKSVERYDPATDTWSPVAPLPVERYAAAAASDLDGRIYAIGGDWGGGPLATVERYDPTAGSWAAVASMSLARHSLSAAADSLGRIYAIGGSDGGSTVRTVERYDPATDTWSVLASLPSGFVGQPVAVGVDAQDRVYAAGGTDTSGAIDTAARYDPTLDAWTTIAAMPTKRYNLAGASDDQGRFYAIGGRGGNTTTADLATVERYDPVAEAWTSLPAMSIARLLFGATVAGNTLYAVGGYSDATGLLASVERAEVNRPPSAPALTSMASGGAIDRAVTNRAAWTFSDPNAGDTQSAFDLRYRTVGAATWTTVAKTTSNQFYDFAAASLATGDYEWQVRTYDSLGVVGPYSPSGFFTAADKPEGVTITDPINGQTISLTAHTVSWSTPTQDSYQLRKVADSAGSPDIATVYYDTGEIASTSVRSRSVDFPVNDRTEHVQVRVKHDGLWSEWASVMVLVSYTPPSTPTATLSFDAATGSLLIAITNPAPAEGAPATSYNDIYVDDGDGEERKATSVTPNSEWRYWTPVSSRDYSTAVRVVAVGTNGTTAST